MAAAVVFSAFGCHVLAFTALVEWFFAKGSIVCDCVSTCNATRDDSWLETCLLGAIGDELYVVRTGSSGPVTRTVCQWTNASACI